MYQTFYYSCFLFILFIIQTPISVFTQQAQFVSKPYSIPIVTTPRSLLLNNNDDSIYDGDSDNSEGDDMYDDGENYNQNSPSTTISQSSLTTNLTSNLNQDLQLNEYDDEISSDQDDIDEDKENFIYADTMSVNRLEPKHPVNGSNNKKSVDSQSTSRMPFTLPDLWRDLLSKPAILVGVIGGIVIGILSAILLVMFIIYRMRKRDEGSYVLDEGPRKSPSHAYTRVSSREFFA